jgi:HD domain
MYCGATDAMYPATIAASYLHDTVEDTSTTIDKIHQAFGPEIAELVYWLTDAEKGKRKIRKLMSTWRLGRAPLEGEAYISPTTRRVSSRMIPDSLPSTMPRSA